MNSYLTDDFVEAFRALPKVVQDRARTCYRLWRQHAYHPSLQFKRVHAVEPLYSVRIGLGWRALGLMGWDYLVLDWLARRL